jgi:hypothetical protein
MTDHTIYQLGWYLKRTPGPGRRALVGSEVFDSITDAFVKAETLLGEGFEVRILPIQGKT